MLGNGRALAVAVLVTSLVGGGAASAATAHRRAPVHRRVHHAHPKRKKLVHAAGWAGAGAAASHLAGPAGSAAVGAAKYRKDLKRNWHTRKRAMVKIGAPIAAGAAAGPVGTAGYEAYEHRHWITKHLDPRSHHHHRRVRHRRPRRRRGVS